MCKLYTPGLRVLDWSACIINNLNRGTRHASAFESGAKLIGRGEIGKGAEETAKGIGYTRVEGAKFTGEKFKEAGKAAGDAPSFPDGVKSFFTRLFSN